MVSTGNMPRPATFVVAVILVSLIGTAIVMSLHENAERASAQDDSEKCLQDADCRSRLEAAVNDIYSEIGYENTYTAP